MITTEVKGDDSDHLQGCNALTHFDHPLSQDEAGGQTILTPHRLH